MRKLKRKKSKEQRVQEKREIEYGINLRSANTKNDYIKNTINGRYYLARCNMLAEQIQSGKILEKIDGATKTVEYMRAEYALMKMQAIMSMRTAYFSKKNLLGEFKLTEADIQALEEDYYNGKIIREDYDDSYKKKNKAEFVKRDKK